ncbi:MAG: sugar ABC transporter ATP-binding protein, partial [Spirochaetales bacterium]|nr:sugar ABC transporter ATP-binding protein [Spirochaetales bacterium]
MPDLSAGTDRLLEIRGLSKSFPGVKALASVDFTLRAGEIHALMGENGAGKSTLIKVLTGLYKKDEGTVHFLGSSFEASSPMDASRKGISTVYQEVNLIPSLSVSENIFIGRQPGRSGKIDWNKQNMLAREALARLDLDLDVTRSLGSYSTAIQQMIAIARALDIQARILILDEPTSSLDQAECEQLFSVMRKLKQEGIGIIFITHFLEQVYEVTDRITVLRNGEYVGEYETAVLSRLQLISHMLGREVRDMGELTANQAESSSTGELFFKAENTGRAGLMNPFDLELREGEVVGLAGLLGAGRTETAKLLFGIEKLGEGSISVDGRKKHFKAPRDAISESIAFCPEDRKTEGIIPDLTVRENICMALQANRSILKELSRTEQEAITNQFVDLLKIKVSDIEQRAETLSGGNQQKLILARWLAMNPRLLILDEPTRGIDVGAKAEIEKLIEKMRQENRSVLFISSELEEVTRCCSRVAVLKDRNKICELSGEEISEDHIMNILAQGGID